MPQERELTPRAVLTGLILGAVLTPCNVYAGLKIGWSFNMSIIALLFGVAFWRPLAARGHVPGWTPKESNISQTTASSAASIISGGLVAPIPAYLLITGRPLAMGPMMAWVFAVSFLGVWVAWYLRPLLIERGQLRFPAGVATLETLTDIFAHGREALRRIAVLAGAALISAITKAVDAFVMTLPKWAPGAWFGHYTLALEPSLLLLGFGGIIGLRVGLSLLAGAVLAWGLLGPALVARGLVTVPPDPAASLFGPLVEWLLWPGVSLMVAASLTSFLWQIVSALRTRGDGSRPRMRPALARPLAGPLLGLLAASAMTVALQMALFDISLPMALVAIPFAVLLATVAARVVGDTGIPPIGAIGKVSQLGFGVMAPGQAVTNLMTANVAGGAAGQCADLLNDLRTGHGLGASPTRQVLAQCVGVLTGSVVGVVVYLALIPDPAMLLTEQWPAPAVATWKAVAEALSAGLGAVPVEARAAMALGALAGLAIGLAEHLLPPQQRRWLPSPVALGLAFVIPGSVSIMMCLGAVLVAIVTRLRPTLAERFAVAASAGLIAGESLMGVAAAVVSMAR
ncbi:OPT family oligopeptide transporter [Nitrogeniibacter mangrovi]|uniref:OPT family oligopeptide transporter n=1 Tax=Nitrogeniibacter mangrovi TaxID=2016596 RepID=A0A6C1B4H6_9RHOO|nr:OPT family oligopeptide transporter [Nitrogeniibacter mangrovi]QID18606.1 OPT family oligopeptide transporter [Nitrogeniibacter mangrovi]